MAQAPDAVESPVLPDAVEAPTPTPGAEPQLPEEVQALKNVLDSHQLRSPDDVEGLVNDLNQFKKGYGDSQNEVGTLRRQVEQLSQQLQATQQPQATEDYYPDQQEPINLRKEMYSVLGEFVNNMQTAQTQGQQRYLAERSKLERMPNWNHLQGAFDQALTKPEVQQAMASGQTDMEKLYLYLNQNYLLNVAQGAQNAINSIPENARRTLSPAPVATGDGRTPTPPTTEDERRDAIEKGKKNMDGQGVLRALIPDGDPITNPHR